MKVASHTTGTLAPRLDPGARGSLCMGKETNGRGLTREGDDLGMGPENPSARPEEAAGRWVPLFVVQRFRGTGSSVRCSAGSRRY